MVNNSDLVKALEKAVFVSKGTRIQKLRTLPIKLLYSKILDLASPWINKPVRIKTTTFWGDRMLVVIPERVSLNIYRYGVFEESLTRMVLEYLEPGMTFLDIGTHFGYFTLLSSFLVGNKGQVHTFEPTPSTFEMLQANIKNKSNIYANNIAAFSKQTSISFNDYGIKYSALNSIFDARLPEAIISRLKPRKYEIKAITIDEYVKNKGIRPDFIKIDAESSEYDILLGMEKTINQFQPMISIEVGDMRVKGVPASKDLIAFLVNRRYQPYEFKDGVISQYSQHVHENEPYQYDNILFLPNQ